MKINWGLNGIISIIRLNPTTVFQPQFYVKPYVYYVAPMW